MIMYVIFALRLQLKRYKIHMVSQMAHAKNLGESFMAHLENLYNMLCKWLAQIQSAQALREPWLWLALNNIP